MRDHEAGISSWWKGGWRWSHLQKGRTGLKGESQMVEGKKMGTGI